VGRAKDYLASVGADAGQLLASFSEPTRPEPVAVVADAGTGAKAPPPINPDQVVPVEVAVVEEAIRASSPRAAAWASFCQALIGSGEFRYLQ
jgi:hypothetical protein